MKKTHLSLFAGIIWLIIITLLLLLPGSAFPQENWLSRLWFDKWVHIGLFAILVFLWCRAFALFKIEYKNLKKIFLSIAFIALAYGAGMEFIQKYYVINRAFEGADIIADGAGCFTGLLFSWQRYIKK